METPSEEQNKVKRMKRTEDSLRHLWDNIKCTNIQRGPRKIREKERVWENFWRDYSGKCPQHGKGNSQSRPRGAKSPIKDKPKEKHAKTHINQINYDYTQRILKAAREKQQVTYNGNPHMLNSWSFIRNTARPEGNGRIDLKYWKRKYLQPSL